MTETINARQAFELLEEVVDDFGYSYVDPGSVEGMGCDYTRHNEDLGDVDDDEAYVGGCIVGQAFHRKGASIAQLRKLYGSIGLLTAEVKSLLDFELTVGARLVLRAAQRVQDKGGKWGEALVAAEDTLRILNTADVE